MVWGWLVVDRGVVGCWGVVRGRVVGVWGSMALVLDVGDVPAVAVSIGMVVHNLEEIQGYIFGAISSHS